MKQISGFSVIGINNGLRLTYTYDDISENGELISQNVRKSFYITDENMKSCAETIFSELNKREESGEQISKA